MKKFVEVAVVVVSRGGGVSVNSVKNGRQASTLVFAWRGMPYVPVLPTLPYSVCSANNRAAKINSDHSF